MPLLRLCTRQEATRRLALEQRHGGSGAEGSAEAAEAAEAAAEEEAAVELTTSLLGAPLSWSSESEEVICHLLLATCYLPLATY